MIDGIPLGTLLNGSPAFAVVMIVVYLMWTDRLVTGKARDKALAEQKRHYDSVIEMKDEQITDYRTSDQISKAQVTKLLETKDLGIAIASSVQREAELAARQSIARGEDS